MQEENDVFTESIRKYFKEVQWRLQQFDDMRREMNVYLAQDFNVFDYIRPDENRVSDILRIYSIHWERMGRVQLFYRHFLLVWDLIFAGIKNLSKLKEKARQVILPIHCAVWILH